MKKTAIFASLAIIFTLLAGTGFANAYTDNTANYCEYEHHGHHGHGGHGHGHDGCWY